MEDTNTQVVCILEFGNAHVNVVRTTFITITSAVQRNSRIKNYWIHVVEPYKYAAGYLVKIEHLSIKIIRDDFEDPMGRIGC